MRCSHNKLENGIRIKCIKEQGHFDNHLTSDGIEWQVKISRKFKCSHNILVNDMHAHCELPSGHEGQHVHGEYEWTTKKQIRQAGSCFYCRANSNRLTIDHIFPKSLGGDERHENCVPCCRFCNQDKDSLKLEQYALKNFKRFTVCCKALGISCGDFLKQYLKEKND